MLKLVVMSATLDAAAFARFFSNANTVYLQVLASTLPLMLMRRLTHKLNQGSACTGSAVSCGHIVPAGSHG